MLNAGKCHPFLLAGVVGSKKLRINNPVLTCHHQLHGEVFAEAVFGDAQDHGVVPSMFWSHISDSQPVFQGVWLVAGVVVLDQFAILVPVWEVPLRFIKCLSSLRNPGNHIRGDKGSSQQGKCSLESLPGSGIYSYYPSTPELIRNSSAVG